MLKINTSFLSEIINISSSKDVINSQNSSDDNDIKCLHSLLNNAIQIEHFTIPLYLTAYYSIKCPSRADMKEVASSIRDVFVDEMNHLRWASNVLAAAGGNPKIYAEDNYPHYPNGPRILHSEGSYPLSHLSEKQMELFIAIEKPGISIFDILGEIKIDTLINPEELLKMIINKIPIKDEILEHFNNKKPTKQELESLAINYTLKLIFTILKRANSENNIQFAKLFIQSILKKNYALSIGEFYQIIKIYLLICDSRIKWNDKTFLPSYVNYLNNDHASASSFERLIEIKNTDDAIRVINLIVEDGEGHQKILTKSSNNLPIQHQPDQKSHYDIFKECLKKKELFTPENIYQIDQDYDNDFLVKRLVEDSDFKNNKKIVRSIYQLNITYNKLIYFLHNSYLDNKDYQASMGAFYGSMGELEASFSSIFVCEIDKKYAPPIFKYLDISKLISSNSASRPATKSAQDYIDKLELKPILEPVKEDGMLRVTKTGDFKIPTKSLPKRFKKAGKKVDIYSSNYYLLQKGEILPLHKLTQDEMWYHHAGDGSIRLHIFEEVDKCEKKYCYNFIDIGGDIDHADLQNCVPGNSWFGAEIITGNFNLSSCCLAPGFHPELSEKPTKKIVNEIIASIQHPDIPKILDRLTKGEI